MSANGCGASRADEDSVIVFMLPLDGELGNIPRFSAEGAVALFLCIAHACFVGVATATGEIRWISCSNGGRALTRGRLRVRDGEQVDGGRNVKAPLG